MRPPIQLRAGTPGDAETCGQICYEAFTAISRAHGFPPDFPSAEVATGLMRMLLNRTDIYSVVAEENGSIVGSNFLWESDPVAGVGPITIDCRAQNRGVGRELMLNVLQRAERRRLPGVRLVQSTFHNRSLSLYTKLGFEVREPLATMQGPALKLEFPGYRVRSATDSDVANCCALCSRIHGHDRGNELRAAVAQNTAVVAEHNGSIAAYSTGVGFFGHTVAATNDSLKALIGGSPEYAGPGFLLPTRNTEVFRWCLEQGLRVVQPLTLMSLGLYNEPKGPLMPSILL